MAEFPEQRFAIKFYVKLGKSGELNTEFADATINRINRFRWYKAFKSERESSELEAWSACFYADIRDYMGMLYTITVPVVQTVNAEYSILVMKRLVKDHIPRKRPHLVGA